MPRPSRPAKDQAKGTWDDYLESVFDDLYGLAQPTTQTFSYSGTLAVVVGSSRFYLEGTGTIVGVRASVGTAPTGASLIIDVSKNGTTVFTNQANRPTIAAASNSSGLVTAIDVPGVVAGDYLTVDVDQVGSTVAGAYLTVTIWIA